MDSQRLLTWLLIAAALILTLNLVAVAYPLYVLLPLVKTLYLLFTMVIYGFFFCRLLYGKKREQPIDFTTAFTVGLIITTFFFYLVSLFKVLFPWVIILYYLAPLPVLVFILRAKPRGANQRGSHEGHEGHEGNRKREQPDFVTTLKTFFRRPAVEYLVFLFPLIYASLPPSFYDSLAYHLGIPNLYLQNAGFIETSQLFYANTFIYYETSLIPAVFAGDLVPRLFHFFMGVILILSAIDFAVDHFKIKKRTILLLTIISMPMSIFLLTAVKNDLPSALLIFLGIRCLLPVIHDAEPMKLNKSFFGVQGRFFQKKPLAAGGNKSRSHEGHEEHEGRFYFSALFWGFAIGIKYTNIIPLAIFLLLYFIKEKRIPFKQVVVFGLIIVGILMPLMVKNFIFTGNPIFPFFHNYFDNKLPYWDSSRFTLLEQDAKKLFYSFTDVVKFPFTLSFSELGSGGIVSPLFLIFLPFLVIKREKRLFLLFFSLLTLLVGANFKLSIRVWAIAFIFLSIYVAIAYESLTHKIMKYLFFVIIGLNVIGAFGLQEYLYRSFNLYSGRVNIEEYKALTFPTYKAIAFVNRNTPPQAKILLVGEAKSYYLKRPYRVSSGYDFSILKKYLDSGTSVGEFIAALKADGIDYIIFNKSEFYRLQEGYKRLTPGEFNRSLEFLQRLKPVFREEGIFVLQI